ncbi:MAG: hypothetical protein KC543_05220 [Myxococcales bacterium]|nr:hypothetical protein [Myxococcales bacterium]
MLVAGSEVPNLLEPHSASTLVVSQDVDVAVPIQRHSEVKARLSRLEGLAPSSEEPSVWLPTDPSRIEVNFIGYDPTETDPTSVRVFEDEALPLMVFGPLSFLRRGRVIDLGDGLLVPVPRNAGLLLEKLVTDRSGVKGDRDLLVALGLVMVATPEDLDELVTTSRSLSRELQHAVRSNLSTLSLLEPIGGMPDPTKERARVAALLERLEREP